MTTERDGPDQGGSADHDPVEKSNPSHQDIARQKGPLHKHPHPPSEDPHPKPPQGDRLDRELPDGGGGSST